MQVDRCFVAVLIFVSISGCSQRTPNSYVAPAFAQPPVNSCPGEDFRTFLRAFASDRKVRFKFTAPFVQVADWRDVNDFDKGVSTRKVAKTEYRDFTLQYWSGSFHHASSDGSVDSTPLDVRVHGAKTGYLVSYIYGMSEGNSWLFERADNCWLLTADPEPPAE